MLGHHTYRQQADKRLSNITYLCCLTLLLPDRGQLFDHFEKGFKIRKALDHKAILLNRTTSAQLVSRLLARLSVIIPSSSQLRVSNSIISILFESNHFKLVCGINPSSLLFCHLDLLQMHFQEKKVVAMIPSYFAVVWVDLMPNIVCITVWSLPAFHRSGKVYKILLGTALEASNLSLIYLASQS